MEGTETLGCREIEREGESEREREREVGDEGRGQGNLDRPRRGGKGWYGREGRRGGGIQREGAERGECSEVRVKGRR